MLEIQKKKSNSFFALLSLPATAMGFGLSVQISALSWILSTKYGLDIHEIGIVWAAGPIAGIIAQPIVGTLSDKMWFMGGRRRPWIIIGGILTAIMLLALPNLHIVQDVFKADGPKGLMNIAIAVAVTLDLSINVSFNPTRSLVADCTTKNERGKGYTWMQTVSGTFGVLAYLIAVLWGNETLIYVGVVVAVLFTLIPIFLIEEPRILNNDEEAESKKSKTTLKDIHDTLLPLYGFLIYGMYAILTMFGVKLQNAVTIGGISLNWIETTAIVVQIICMVVVLLNVQRRDKNTFSFQKILLAHSFTWWGVQTMNIYMFFYVSTVISGLNEGSMQAVNSWAFLVRDLVGAILPVLVLNEVSKRIGMTRTHNTAIFLMAVGYALLYLMGANITLFFIYMIVVGIGWASIVSLPFAIMSEKVDQTKMGLYMGIFNLSVVLPQLVASFKMGEVVNNAPDKSIIFAICAVTLLISGVLWVFVGNDKPIKVRK
ncbi:MAG: MFS transporter [Paludibacteraceae bacterium]